MRIIAQILLFFISTGFSNMYTHALCSVHSFLRKLVEFLVSTKMTQKKRRPQGSVMRQEIHDDVTSVHFANM